MILTVGDNGNIQMLPFLQRFLFHWWLSRHHGLMSSPLRKRRWTVRCRTAQTTGPTLGTEEDKRWRCKSQASLLGPTDPSLWLALLDRSMRESTTVQDNSKAEHLLRLNIASHSPYLSMVSILQNVIINCVWNVWHISLFLSQRFQVMYTKEVESFGC